MLNVITFAHELSQEMGGVNFEYFGRLIVEMNCGGGGGAFSRFLQTNTSYLFSERSW